jgi:hypothetical protein
MSRTWIILAAALGCALLGPAGAPGGTDAKKQRIAIDIKQPLTAPKGRFVLETMTSGSLKDDTGSITFTSGPTAVFSGRIVEGQRVDRFRGKARLASSLGTLAVRVQVDFVSAGSGYQVGSGTWSVVSGTGQYAGLAGGGRSALVNPVSGGFGFARYEGLVSRR